LKKLKNTPLRDTVRVTACDKKIKQKLRNLDRKTPGCAKTSGREKNQVCERSLIGEGNKAVLLTHQSAT
jgi:hypothetical protein